MTDTSKRMRSLLRTSVLPRTWLSPSSGKTQCGNGCRMMRAVSNGIGTARKNLVDLTSRFSSSALLRGICLVAE